MPQQQITRVLSGIIGGMSADKINSLKWSPERCDAASFVECLFMKEFWFDSRDGEELSQSDFMTLLFIACAFIIISTTLSYFNNKR